MKKLLLILLCVPLIGFGQEPGETVTEEKQDIYFEGEVESETLYDGIFYITVKMKKGELAGELVDIYFQVSGKKQDILRRNIIVMNYMLKEVTVICILENIFKMKN